MLKLEGRMIPRKSPVLSNSARRLRALIVGLAICLLPFSSCTYSTISQASIDEMTERYDSNCSTAEDIKTLKKLYQDIIRYGGLPYPEASRILSHYLFGNGDDLIIRSKAIIDSPFLQNKVSEGKTVGPITVDPGKYPRIGFAVNGFYISEEAGEVVVRQYIDFDGRNGKGYFTDFPRLRDKLRIPDRLARAFELTGGCKPFTVSIKR